PVADDDRHVGEARGREVTQGDIHDGGLPVHGDERLRQRVGVRTQPASGAGGEYQTDHGVVPSEVRGVPAEDSGGFTYRECPGPRTPPGSGKASAPATGAERKYGRRRPRRERGEGGVREKN